MLLGSRVETRPHRGSGAVVPPHSGPTVAREMPTTLFKILTKHTGPAWPWWRGQEFTCFSLAVGTPRLGACFTWAASGQCPQQSSNRLSEAHQKL